MPASTFTKYFQGDQEIWFGLVQDPVEITTAGLDISDYPNGRRQNESYPYCDVS
jgi:hypothetical protein